MLGQLELTMLWMYYMHIYSPEATTFAAAEKRTETCHICWCFALQNFLKPSVHLIKSTLKFLTRRYMEESGSKPILGVLLNINCSRSNTKNCSW